MSGPEDLVTDEGVDEGSAASAAESTDGDAGPDPDVLGEPPHGAPVDETEAAGPVDMESAESREARAERGSGQQLQAGEG